MMNKKSIRAAVLSAAAAALSFMPTGGTPSFPPTAAGQSALPAIARNSFLSPVAPLSSLPAAAERTEAASGRPNILFIAVDDLRPELACYGRAHIKSPNIDRLARSGVLFTQAYVNYPICGASRASLLSGIRPGRDRFRTWTASQDDEVPGVVSLPMHFRNHHYRTVSLGKVYNNFEDGQGSWDEIWRAAITMWDYQAPSSINLFETLNRERNADTAARTRNNLPARGVAYEKAAVGDAAYADGKIAERAVEELQELQNSGQPFFLAVGFKKPHLPFNAPEKYWDMYDENEIALPDNYYRPKDAPDAAMHEFGELRAYYGMPREGPLPDSTARRLIHGYYACVSYMDAQVGKVLDELENLGLAENTIVVFWGDHGWQLGEHALWCKHANFNTSVHIPLIVKAPGKKSGLRQEGLVESVDIYPTLCELAGLRQPFHLQGKSFAPMLDDPGYAGKDAIFYRNGQGESILTATHAYTEWFRAGSDQPYARMLYDRRNDPEENTNIAERPESQALIRELREKLYRNIEARESVTIQSK